MGNQSGDLERVREHVVPTWDARKLQQELGRLEARVEKRKRGRFVAVLSVAGSGACALALLLTPSASAPHTQASVARVEAPQAPVQGEPTIDSEGMPSAGPDGPSESANAQASVEAAAPTADAGASERTEPLRARRARVSVAGTAWRSLAREGHYHEAYRAMRGSEPDGRRAEIDELLLAGDAARLSGHAREAIPYYRAALDKAGKTPRAHLTAFTLARTLLNDLHDPRAAAEAFGRAYRAAPHGPLAEEALAREAESFSRAGDGSRARAARERYRAAFPRGRLMNEVKLEGGDR